MFSIGSFPWIGTWRTQCTGTCCWRLFGTQLSGLCWPTSSTERGSLLHYRYYIVLCLWTTLAVLIKSIMNIIAWMFKKIWKILHGAFYYLLSNLYRLLIVVQLVIHVHFNFSCHDINNWNILFNNRNRQTYIISCISILMIEFFNIYIYMYF